MIVQSVAPGPSPKRWTREEYERFVDLGAITPGDHVEFIEGEIVQKMSQKPGHSNAVGRTTLALSEIFGREFLFREGRPVIVEESEPEPDVSVVRGPLSRYDREHPQGNDLILLVEVSDTSLGYDRGRKAALYARGGVREYWILDLNARRLLVHRGPMTDGAWEEVRGARGVGAGRAAGDFRGSSRGRTSPPGGSLVESTMPTISDGAAFLLVGVALWLVPFLCAPRGSVAVRRSPFRILVWGLSFVRAPALACFVLAAVMPWGRAAVWGSGLAQFGL